MAQLEVIEAALHDGVIGSISAKRLLEVPSVPNRVRPYLERISGIAYRGILIPTLRTEADFAVGDEVGVISRLGVYEKGAFITKLTAEQVIVSVSGEIAQTLTESLQCLRIWSREDFFKVGCRRPYAQHKIAHHIAELQLALDESTSAEELADFRSHFKIREPKSCRSDTD